MSSVTVFPEESIIVVITSTGYINRGHFQRSNQIQTNLYQLYEQYYPNGITDYEDFFNSQFYKDHILKNYDYQ